MLPEVVGSDLDHSAHFRIQWWGLKKRRKTEIVVKKKRPFSFKF